MDRLGFMINPKRNLNYLHKYSIFYIMGIGTSGIIVSAADIPLLPLMNIE